MATAARIPTVPPEVQIFLDAVKGKSGQHPYAALLGLKTYDTPALHQRVKAGLSFAALEKLRRTLDLPTGTVAEVLHIPARTIHRRKKEGRLDPDESDRLLRLSRLVGAAIQLFEGDIQATRSWLHAPLPALGGATPIALAETEPGALEVEALIGKLEHGIFV